MKQHSITFAAAALCLLSACAATTDDSVDQQSRDGLLFGLHEADVVELNERYLADEPLEETMARLQAPFDCSMYDDLCKQIGRDRAIELTAELVDMGLDEATLEEIDARVEERLDEGMDLRNDEEDAEAEIDFRSSTGWYSRTSGNHRMLVRNGISTPVVGSRKGWTEAKTQRRNSSGGTWRNRKATEICADTGNNEQRVAICGSGIPCTYNTFENYNPSNVCQSSTKSFKSQTTHNRNSGSESSVGSVSYRIRVRGCATAEINGVNLSSACPPTHTAFF